MPVWNTLMVLCMWFGFVGSVTFPRQGLPYYDIGSFFMLVCAALGFVFRRIVPCKETHGLLVTAQCSASSSWNRLPAAVNLGQDAINDWFSGLDFSVTGILRLLFHTLKLLGWLCLYSLESFLVRLVLLWEFLHITVFNFTGFFIGFLLLIASIVNFVVRPHYETYQELTIAFLQWLQEQWPSMRSGLWVSLCWFGRGV